MLRLVAINLAVLAALLLGIEGAVRLVVPEAQPMGMAQGFVEDRVYGEVAGLAASAMGRTNGMPVATTAHRTWQYGGDPSGPLDPAAPAWLLLGDSVTMGLGVDADSTAGGRLAAQTDTMRVLNPSGPGNDAYRHTPTAPPPGLGTGRLGEAVLGFLRRHVRTYAVLKATLTDRPAAYLAYDLHFYDGTLPDSTAALAAAADALADLATLADSAGARFEIVGVPYAAQLRYDTPQEAYVPQRILAERLRAHGLPLVDAMLMFWVASPTHTDRRMHYL